MNCSLYLYISLPPISPRQVKYLFFFFLVWLYICHLLSRVINDILFIIVFGVDIRMIIAAITFPICVGKQIISVIQFVGASKVLARIDVAESATNGRPAN